jgi:outer membrane protein
MKFMKLRTGLLSAMAIAICVSCNKSKPSNTPASTATVTQNTVSSSKIVYVEIDTIMHQYNMAKELGTALEDKQKRLDADLSSKSKTFQASAMDFQNKVQKGLITNANAQEMQQQLASQEQGLYQLRDQYRSQIAEEAQVNQRQIIQSIMDYLKEYNKEKGYQYILANQFPSSILYADSSLNITREVIVGLNTKYKTTNKK